MSTYTTPAQLKKLRRAKLSTQICNGPQSLCGRNYRTTITYSRSSFCSIFYNWQSACGLQEKLSRAACGLWAVCCAGMTYTV